MADYVTKKPSGLSIRRNGATLTLNWKISDANYSGGQTMQYRYYTTKWGSWKAITVTGITTQKSLVVPVANYYPNTKKQLKAVEFRVRGKRLPFQEQRSNNTTVTITPKVSEWSKKSYDIILPNVPTIAAALSSSSTNVTTFTWAVATAADSRHWFTNVELQTQLVKNSTITDGAKLSSSAWAAQTTGGATGSTTITEDTSLVNLGTPYTRWVRIRARGPQGWTAWKYARHVYSIPYQTKNVKASASMQDSGGYLCRVNWTTNRDAAHPVDSIHVQYTFATPDAGLTCPDGASWTDGQSLAYKDGSDSAAFSIDNTVGIDQCLFVRINTVHDRNTTYGVAAIAAVGPLATPTGLSVTTDTSTHRATVTATNASAVADSFMVVRYMTTANPSGFDIGVIPHGQTSVTVTCPAFSSTSNIRFSVRAVVGSYRVTTRADGVGSYAVTQRMVSPTLEYGGTVPAAPANVTLSMTDTPGTIHVEFDWSWQTATQAELSWADHADAWESTDEPSVYTIANTHASKWNISGLETGKTWYVRVRLASGTGDSRTYGAYSATKSIDLSSAPSIPILTLSSAVITDNGSVTASWAFSSTDGTGQAAADLAESVNGVYRVIATARTQQYINLSNMGWEAGETHLLAVRVTSTSGRQSDWSDVAAVTVAAPLVVSITSTSLVDQTITVDGQSRTVKSLTAMPFGITVTGAGAGGLTRVVIARAEDYHVDRPDESSYNGFEGETIAMFTQLGESAISITNEDLIGRLDDGAVYDVIATVQDGLGQSAETTQRFEVHWAHQAEAPTAEVTIDNTEMIAILTPIAPDGAAEGDRCDIYRLSVDKPELIYPGAEFGTEYVDPYPTIGEYGGHRFVTVTANGDYITANDELAWFDTTAADDGDVLETLYNIIDYGNGRVLLGYNVDLGHKWAKDFKETKYLGGSIQGDWNPATSSTGTFNTVVMSDDQATIESMRRLATHAGICHVRTKDGSSYAADVQVSEDYKQSSAHRIVTFGLSITRVDTETYDGMTLEEWQGE